MLQRIFIAALLICSFRAMGQQKTAPAKPAEPKIDYKAVGAPMPDILVVTLDSVDIVSVPVNDGKKHRRKNRMKDEVHPVKTNRVTNKDVDNDANLIVMMFNPTCGHCEDQTQKMEKDIALFKKTKWILLAKPNMSDYLPNFTKTYHTKDFPNIICGVDSSDFMNQTFLYSALPQINVYSADRKLIRAFAGEVSIDTLKQYIQ